MPNSTRGILNEFLKPDATAATAVSMFGACETKERGCSYDMFHETRINEKKKVWREKEQVRLISEVVISSTRRSIARCDKLIIFRGFFVIADFCEAWETYGGEL